MNTQKFLIYQYQDGVDVLLYEVYDEDTAEDYVNRMNSHLADAGIPSWVSSYFYR